MNLDWIAGFFDGEGSVSLLVEGLNRKCNEHRFGFFIAPKISVSQKDPKILHEIKDFLGYGFVEGRNFTIRKHADIHRWLGEIGPRCIVKRPQVELLQDAMQHFKRTDGVYVPKSEMLALLECLEKMRELNRFRNVKRWHLSALRERVLRFDERMWRDQRHMMALRGWEKRHPGRTPLSVELVRDLYDNKRLTVKEIAASLGRHPATIRRFMQCHNILCRKGGPPNPLERLCISPAQIREFYHERKLNAREIANNLDCSESAVFSFMNHHGIMRRSKSDAMHLMFQKRPKSVSGMRSCNRPESHPIIVAHRP